MKSIVAYGKDEFGDTWTTQCPYCYAMYDHSGFFCSEDIQKCQCGKEYKVIRMELEDGGIIE